MTTTPPDCAGLFAQVFFGYKTYIYITIFAGSNKISVGGKHVIPLYVLDVHC